MRVYNKVTVVITQSFTFFMRKAPWPSGRASDSRARGRGFDPHSGPRVVSLSKIHLPPKKYWLYPGSGGSVPT